MAKDAVEENYSENPSFEMVDYMQPQRQISLDKLSFADVMQFADFGPKVAPNDDDENYFLKFHEVGPSSNAATLPPEMFAEEGGGEEDGRFSENNSSVQHLGDGKSAVGGVEVKNRRKRPRAMKSTEEVESQRMTHIAVERNRRRQMNEHLRVLRSLMPGSYVHRGDQASIIGGAIEFLRELEQLLQCLESQKRRRLFSGSTELPRNMTSDAPPVLIPNIQPSTAQQQPFFPLPLPLAVDVDNDPTNIGSLREEMAENKSSLADIEVRLLGSDVMIKILSRRRTGQLIKMIASLEDLQFTILHTNITTIDQTVLYSFNLKIADETRWTAEGIANSVQQILSFIDGSII